jgi:flagellar biosynthesis/type III secretory pathway protein FliH
LYDAVWAYTNEKELLQLKENFSDGGEINMCQAIRELVEDGRQEGYVSGRQEGYVFGKQEGYTSGQQDGIEIGIRASIQLLHEVGMPETNIVEAIARKFEVSEADAISYVNKYRN